MSTSRKGVHVARHMLPEVHLRKRCRVCGAVRVDPSTDWSFARACAPCGERYEALAVLRSEAGELRPMLRALMWICRDYP